MEVSGVSSGEGWVQRPTVGHRLPLHHICFHEDRRVQTRRARREPIPGGWIRRRSREWDRPGWDAETRTSWVDSVGWLVWMINCMISGYPGSSGDRFCTSWTTSWNTNYGTRIHTHSAATLVVRCWRPSHTPRTCCFAGGCGSKNIALSSCDRIQEEAVCSRRDPVMPQYRVFLLLSNTRLWVLSASESNFKRPSTLVKIMAKICETRMRVKFWSKPINSITTTSF